MSLKLQERCFSRMKALLLTSLFYGSLSDVVLVSNSELYSIQFRFELNSEK